jgi:hypothetical protein
MCSIDWAELRLWVAPAITAIGIFISVMAAIFIPRHQKRLDRLAYANAAADGLTEAIGRIWDRLEIRFDPPSYARTGRKMRQFRADGAMATLADFKVSELPIELVSTFGAARTGLNALNVAMNTETEWPPATNDIERYKVVYEDVKNAVLNFNEASLGIETKLAKLSFGSTPELSDIPIPQTDESKSDQ